MLIKKPPNGIAPLSGFYYLNTLSYFKESTTSLNTESYPQHHPTFQLLAIDLSSQ